MAVLGGSKVGEEVRFRLRGRLGGGGVGPGLTGIARDEESDLAELGIAEVNAKGNAK
jgi:hypothetical protein